MLLEGKKNITDVHPLLIFIITVLAFSYIYKFPLINPAFPVDKSMQTQLTSVEILPRSTHKYTVIWLHGLGADGHDFADIVPLLQLEVDQHIHFIFPHAPIQPVTINGGSKMRSWYDILEMSLQREVDIAGIYQSSSLIVELIKQEMAKGILAENIFLAGFSQGGVIALHTGLRYQYRLAGIIALSTYLPTLEQLRSERASANNSTPIFMAHGVQDPVVAFEEGKHAYAHLLEMGYPITWQNYQMQHAVCPEEINDLSNFINAIVASKK